MEQAHDPTRYRRRILVCVTGLTPQIVTETIYGLAVCADPPFLPTEIHLITTHEGADRAKLTLLESDPGQFRRLCEDYGLDAAAIRFCRATIHPIRDAGGRPLSDIRSPGDNQAAADTITALLRELTADPDCAVHVSIAGGRKTMGYYVGYALSLFGRPQDRLSHVLVDSDLEGDPQFFYPPPKPKVLYNRANKPVRADLARITLADIPFVRMRDGLTDAIVDGHASFSEAVDQAQRSLQAPRLAVDSGVRTLDCGGTPLALKPADFAFYAWFARRAKEAQPGVCRSDITAEDTAQYLAAYPKRDELSGDFERVAAAVGEAMGADYFDQRKSRVNRALDRALGRVGAASYQITRDGSRPRSRYRLPLRPEQIRFIETEDYP